MKFGDYIKQKRDNAGWTQPIAAKHVGIEQSYLSKLESGKSYPSDEIVEKLVAAYEVDYNEMTQTVESEELQKLGHVKSVRLAILSQQQGAAANSRRWFYAGLLSVVLGGACLGAAVIPHASDTQYQYRSEGVLQPGESLTAFDEVYSTGASQSAAMLARVNQDDQVLSTYRGENYIEVVSEGTRFYQLYARPDVRAYSSMRYFLIPAVALLLGGVGCFLIGLKRTAKP